MWIRKLRFRRKEVFVIVDIKVLSAIEATIHSAQKFWKEKIAYFFYIHRFSFNIGFFFPKKFWIKNIFFSKLVFFFRWTDQVQTKYFFCIFLLFFFFTTFYFLKKLFHILLQFTHILSTLITLQLVKASLRAAKCEKRSSGAQLFTIYLCKYCENRPFTLEIQWMPRHT